MELLLILLNKRVSHKIFFLILSFLISCNITEDAECKKQKEGAKRCINAFILFCSGNKSRPECNGSLESNIFIGSFCQYDAACKSSSEDVVKEEIKFKK